MTSVVTGMEAHAGPTPMALRKDALQVAAALMQEVVACAHRHPPHGRGTVGMVNVHPNSRNVIPGRVKFSIDLRNASDELCELMDADIRAVAVAVRLGAESGLPIKITPVSAYTAQPFHADCVQAVARAAAALGYSNMPVVSGAGHDAVYMARLAPAGMIFIPCKDGISHNEIESAKPEHISAGCNVLLHAMLERAGVAPGERQLAAGGGRRRCAKAARIAYRVHRVRKGRSCPLLFSSRAFCCATTKVSVNVMCGWAH